MADDFTTLTDEERAAEFDRALRLHGLALCEADPALYAAILNEVVEKHYTCKPGQFARCIKQVYRLAARRDGHVEIAEWLASRIA